MDNFINTIDVLGDEVVYDSIINRTITEFKDNRITSIRTCTFNKCTNLTTLDVPSVISINDNAFNGCTVLNSINIPAVTRIEAYNTFSNCKALTKVVLPSCSYIGQGAFSFCFRLETIDCAVTDNLYIGNNAFGSINDLKALIIRSNSVATMANKNALLESGIYYGRGYIYVPSALMDSYKSATNWNNFSNYFRALEDYTVDGTTTSSLDESKI